MRTPSHFILSAALAKAGKKRIPIATTACLLGSVAPDVPLVLLSTGTAFYLFLTQGRPLTGAHAFMFNDLFYNNPLWIVTHNSLHAPLVLTLGLALSWSQRRAVSTHGHRLFWFFAAAAFHTTVDIATHASDGPLLLFPFDWTLRFHSPVSYWEPGFYPEVVTFLEYGLDLAALLYLSVTRLRRRTS